MPFVVGAERGAYTWTRNAFQLIVDGSLQVELSHTPDEDLFASGPCPRCGHDVDYQRSQRMVLPQGVGWRGLAGGSASPQPGATAYKEYPVMCSCAEDHPGRPAGALGCGVVFNVNLPTA